MKKIISALAAIAVITPSIASASSASQALSVKAAAVEPIRAGAKAEPNAMQASASGTLIAVLAAAALITGIVILADSDSDSD